MLALIGLAAAAPSLFANFDGKKCCVGPCPPNLAKYYSIDKTYDQCGEACIDPSKYSLLKIFEPGLTKATTDSPCADVSYTEYVTTDTHGGFGLSVTIDMYKKNK